MNEGTIKLRHALRDPWADYNLFHGAAEMQLAERLAKKWAEAHEQVASEGDYSPAVFRLALSWLLWDVRRHGPVPDAGERPF